MAMNDLSRLLVGLGLSIYSVVPSAQTMADLSIIVAGPASATFGDRLVYSVTVTNNGPDAASNVVVSLSQLPYPFGTISDPCSLGFPCALGSVGASQSVVIPSIPLQTPYIFCSPCNDPVPLIFLASVTTDTSDPNTVNNQAEIVTSLSPVRALPVVPIDADWMLLGLGALLGLCAVFAVRDRRFLR
jgi:Domain of unknown function DUF11